MEQLLKPKLRAYWENGSLGEDDEQVCHTSDLPHDRTLAQWSVSKEKGVECGTLDAYSIKRGQIVVC